MITKQITCNRDIKGRTAANFIKQANNFKGSLFCQKGERRVNGKSLLGILSLDICKRDKVTIFCEDEFTLDIIEKFLQNGG